MLSVADLARSLFKELTFNANRLKPMILELIDFWFMLIINIGGINKVIIGFVH